MISLKDKYHTLKKRWLLGNIILRDPFFIKTMELSELEIAKEPSRTRIINYLLKNTPALHYLEIGVRNPEHNFNKINCRQKYSVDPGYEYRGNPATYKMTSDMFFERLNEGVLDLLPSVRFDVIFIDGLHTAEQVEKDINNSLRYLKQEGFIVLHDCNPPSEFHQRECFAFKYSPARIFWNGTTWKVYYKFRHSKELYSACFDTDWGVAVLTRKQYAMFNNLEVMENPFFEYQVLDSNRRDHLNLIDFFDWKETLEK